MSVLKRNNVHAKEGDGPVLRQAHGFGCNQHRWGRIWPAFSATHRQLLCDYVGSGESERAEFSPMRYASLQACAQDVIEVCDALQELRVAPALALGHQMRAVGLRRRDDAVAQEAGHRGGLRRFQDSNSCREGSAGGAARTASPAEAASARVGWASVLRMNCFS